MSVAHCSIVSVYIILIYVFSYQSSYIFYKIQHTPPNTECCAEHNAIVSAFRYHADLTNCILYTTAPPCYKCAQMIVQSGIKTVVHGKGSKPMSDEIFYWAKVATL